MHSDVQGNGGILRLMTSGIQGLGGEVVGFGVLVLVGLGTLGVGFTLDVLSYLFCILGLGSRSFAVRLYGFWVLSRRIQTGHRKGPKLDFTDFT